MSLSVLIQSTEENKIKKTTVGQYSSGSVLVLPYETMRHYERRKKKKKIEKKSESSSVRVCVVTMQISFSVQILQYFLYTSNQLFDYRVMAVRHIHTGIVLCRSDGFLEHLLFSFAFMCCASLYMSNRRRLHRGGTHRWSLDGLDSSLTSVDTINVFKGFTLNLFFKILLSSRKSGNS